MVLVWGLGELYGGAVETRIANDYEELMRWVVDGGEPGDTPRTIGDAAFQESRLDTLRSRNSAAYKGLNVLILREGAKDFFWKASIQELDGEDIALDIHHIFPKAWCEDEGIPANTVNSIVNKTPISYKANRMIGRKSPSDYLGSLQAHKQVGLDDEQMDAILASHRIPVQELRSDDFVGFYAARKANLLNLVEFAMGKAPQFDQSNSNQLPQQEAEHDVVVRKDIG